VQIIALSINKKSKIFNYNRFKEFNRIMKKIKTKWQMEPGDGTGSSIADARIRNEKGICALKDCNKKINKRSHTLKIFDVKICLTCHNKVQKIIKKVGLWK